MLVAVVLSCGGNHAAEMAGGAAITVTPARPFKMAQMWLITVNVVSSSDTTLKVEPGVQKGGLERTHNRHLYNGRLCQRVCSPNRTPLKITP